MKEKQDQLGVKEEILSYQEEILPSYTCTVYKQEEDAQMKYTEIKG